MTTVQTETTTVAISTTTELPTTTELQTTTEDPANFPKEGLVELLVEDITYTGHMLHWSVAQNYLAISDIWGQKYLRFEEVPEVTTGAPTTTDIPSTTVAQSTTETPQQTIIVDLTTTTDSSTTTEIPTTTELPTTTGIPTTTAEALPYTIHTLSVSPSVVYMLKPQNLLEGAFPIFVPVEDALGTTDNTDEAVMGYNERLHLVHWDLTEDLT